MVPHPDEQLDDTLDPLVQYWSHARLPPTSLHVEATVGVRVGGGLR